MRLQKCAPVVLAAFMIAALMISAGCESTGGGGSISAPSDTGGSGSTRVLLFTQSS